MELKKSWIANYDIGVFILGSKKYRYILAHDTTKNKCHNFMVSSPSELKKWMGELNLSIILFQKLVSTNNLSYKFCSEDSSIVPAANPSQNTPHLSIKFGKDWVTLFETEYTPIDYFIEQLIQENKGKDLFLQEQAKQLQNFLKESSQKFEEMEAKLLKETNQRKAEIEEFMDKQLGKAIYKVKTTSSVAHGGFVNWTSCDINLATGYISHKADKIVIHKSGTYQIIFRCTTYNSSNNGFLGLYLNNSQILQNYQNTNSTYYNTHNIVEVLNLAEGDEIKFYNSNSAGYTSQYDTQTPTECTVIKI